MMIGSLYMDQIFLQHFMKQNVRKDQAVLETATYTSSAASLMHANHHQKEALSLFPHPHRPRCSLKRVYLKDAKPHHLDGVEPYTSIVKVIASFRDYEDLTALPQDLMRFIT